MRYLRRFAVIFLCSAFSLALAFPLALYYLGLSGVEGRPPKPPQVASKEQQALVWNNARGSGAPHVEAMNPYAFVFNFLVKKEVGTPPGQLVAWRVASGYLLHGSRYRGMGWWHLSGAALTIWLTRHWTSEEILSAASLDQQHATDANRLTLPSNKHAVIH